MNKNKLKSKKGITLIALVITIVILIILASIAINGIIGENGLISRAQEAKFKSKMTQIAEEWNLKSSEYAMDDLERTDISDIYAGEELVNGIAKEEELEIDKVYNIRELIKSVGKKEEEYTIIFQGELYYVSQEKITNNKKQVKWCEDLGIKIYEFENSTGIKSTNGDYELINNEYYMCTPRLTTGFKKYNTRYAKLKGGNLIAGNWINKKPDDDWYDYSKQNWANIYVENEGIESYYVWVPRYVYKLDSSNERTDIKFVDTQNTYKDKNGKETNWETLQTQGYQLPEAFTWGDDLSTQLPGYWMSKYQLSDSGTYNVDFKVTATASTMTIKEIKLAKGKTAATYTYAINGKILHTSKKAEEYTIKGLAKGDKSVNVTALNEKGEIVGSLTKLYQVAEVNEPDLTGFDKDTTFYVYWDENGIEHNETPISKSAPSEWYDYTTANWANIVTRNNGEESYFVWIPRYEYQINSTNQRTYIRFLKGTSTETSPGYQIPEAFSWGDELNTQLTGYWMSKYQLSEATSTNKVVSEFTFGEDKVVVGNITGSVITEENLSQGLKFEYYINGDKKHEGTDPNENYVFTGLKTGETYTVNIIVRKKYGNEYLGAVTKKDKTISINKPELAGLNAQNTYYVTYDKDGNEVIGDKIKNDGSNMPSNWYDYSNHIWANIVTTDGKVKNGKIVDATSTSYFIWIPRYQYSTNSTTQRVDIKFLEGTSQETLEGYQIPEAFSWGDDLSKQLKGYWMSKYQLSE